MKVVILGGGVSGLSLAFWLQKFCEVVVLEKEEQAGGWLQTEQSSGFLFDKGPRTFRYVPIFQTLIEELKLSTEVIFSAPSARNRYLFQKGKLSPISKWKLLPSLLKEWNVSSDDAEETIADFATRRFGKEVAETIFDALCLGVYGGDMHALSVNACFPTLKGWELKYGSVVKGFLKEFKSTPLFSFKGGSGILTQTLADRLGDSLKKNQTVTQVEFHNQKVTVVTSEKHYHADYVISALPPPAVIPLFPHLTAHVSQLNMQSLNIISCGFDKKVLPVTGFGYLVPSREKEEVLGCVFDSEIFPQHNSHTEQTRLTVMMRDTKDPVQTVQDALKRHLKVEAPPDWIHIRQAPHAIAQFELGHQAWATQLQKKAQFHYPRLFLTGNFLKGVSVAECLTSAQQLAQLFSELHC